MTARSGPVARAVRRAVREASPAPNVATVAVLTEQAALVDLLAATVRGAVEQGAPVPAVPVQYLALMLRDLHAVLPALDAAPADELADLLAMLQEPQAYGPAEVEVPDTLGVGVEV